MKFTTAALTAAALCASALALPVRRAPNSFAGANLYYAAGLSSDDANTLFTGMQSAGMKVLRVWLDGESDATSKGTNIVTYPDLEPNVIGQYDDTVLGLLDNIMVTAQSFGIKLLVSMHSFNALQANDVYGQAYGIGDFYEFENATSQFDARLVHILNHNHTTLGTPWKELSEYIIGFEAENEAMIGNGEAFIQQFGGWQCDRATTIKNTLGDDSGMLVFTGGESFLSESVQSAYLACPDIDVVSIHAYGVGDLETGAIQPFVDQAQTAGKLLIFEEWGACFFDTANNDCPNGDALDADTRNANIAAFAGNITAAGIPWLYWEVLPNPDPHFGEDYEIGINDPSWPALQTAALAAAQAPAVFDFSAFLP